jgi:AcrR family transcriptional regulator
MCEDGAVPKRKYEQKLRADTAEQTRRRILDAVADRLRTAPGEPVSMDKVAQAAGVARSTIYVVFDSRAGLFEAFVADLYERTGLTRLSDAVDVPDVRQHLRGGLLAASQMFAADIEIYRALFGMSRINPDSVGGAVNNMEDGRRGGMKYLAKRLDEEGALRDDVTRKRAIDILWVITAFETFDLLYGGRELPVEETAELLTTTAERALCR